MAKKRNLKTLLVMAVVLMGAAGTALAVGSVELHKLTASDAAAQDYFGVSVALSGATAIVGASRNDDAGYLSGSAYIFAPNSIDPNNWDQQAKLTASDAAYNARFGFSVAISGDTAVVGAFGGNGGTGSAYIFAPNELDPNNWDQQAKLTASDAAGMDGFGYSVAISGNTAVIGAEGNDDNGSTSGSAYIFRFNSSNWVEEQKLVASDGAAYDSFGVSVAISGDTAVIGAYGDDSDSGSAYVFHFDGSSWVQEQKLLASDGAEGYRFGCSAAISGDTAVVGAYGGTGSAYLFDAATGVQLFKLTASDAAAGDYFGRSVALSGATALVGASWDDDAGDKSGSAYLFDVSDPCNPVEIAKLTASDAAASDVFGYSVAISGSTALVGALGNDDAGSNSGSAYLFGLCLFPPVGDINLDCRVNFRDFALMAGNWLVDCILEPSDPACLAP